MKKLIVMLVFLVLLVVPVSANSCDIYWEKLVGQCFETTINDTEYTLCFSDSTFGPCPSGIVTLEYVDVQIIDEIPYEAIISEDFYYSTNQSGVIIADLQFTLLNDFLVYTPEGLCIFDRIVE